MRSKTPASFVVACLALMCCSAPAPADTLAAAHAPATADTVARLGIPQALLAHEKGVILLVDVRSPAQRSLGHITGDASLPIDHFSVEQRNLPRDRRMVFYCSCPADEVALDAARRMIAAGNPNVAVLVGGFDAWRAAHGPVQKDATWEETFRVDQSPVGWGRTPVDSLRCRYARDDQVAAHGIASGRIGCRADTAARGFAGFVQRIDAAPVRGRDVTFSAMVRSEAVAQFGFLWVGAEDAEGRTLSMTRAQSPITGNHDWQANQVTGTVPESAARVLIGISLAGAGRIWIDEVQLVARAAGDLPRVPVVVANADFEK